MANNSNLYYYNQHCMNFSRIDGHSSFHKGYDNHSVITTKDKDTLTNFHFYNLYTSVKQFRRHPKKISTSQFEDDIEFKYCKELYNSSIDTKKPLNIIKSYFFPEKSLKEKIHFINQSRLLDFKVPKPKGLHLYDKGMHAFLRRYRNITTGSLGENYISNELSKNHIKNRTDINIPCLYMTEDGFKKSKNQMDVLSVNNHGVFIFEVKSYSRPFWIDKDGQYSFYVDKTHNIEKHIKYHPVFQQLLEHKRAILYNIKQSGKFNKAMIANLARVTYVPLVCVDISGKNTFWSNYQYDKDKSRECNVRVLSQDDCVNYIKHKPDAFVSTQQIENVINCLESCITERYYPFFEPSDKDVVGMKRAYQYVECVNRVFNSIKEFSCQA